MAEVYHLPTVVDINKNELTISNLNSGTNKQQRHRQKTFVPKPTEIYSGSTDMSVNYRGKETILHRVPNSFPQFIDSTDIGVKRIHHYVGRQKSLYRKAFSAERLDQLSTNDNVLSAICRPLTDAIKRKSRSEVRLTSYKKTFEYEPKG